MRAANRVREDGEGREGGGQGRRAIRETDRTDRQQGRERKIKREKE